MAMATMKLLSTKQLQEPSHMIIFCVLKHL